MITMRNFMETVNYRITEGGEYGWSGYGPNAYSLDSWNGDNDQGYSASIVFDTKTQLVYEMIVCDYKNQRAYRWIHPDFRDAYEKDAKSWDADKDQAWDDVSYIDLEVEDDMLDKAKSIVNGLDYDARIQVPIDLPDDELMDLFKMAHERDMTFNDFVTEILTEALKRTNDNKSKDVMFGSPNGA